MIMVVRKLDGMGYRKAIASLRLVSQSWKAAVREHPMRANPIRVERNCELRKLCQIMPKMRELSIFSQEQVINLLPLSGLTSLTKVSLYGFEYAALTEVPQLRANLSTLPSTLKTLNLTYVDLPPNCLNSLNVTNLKLLNLELEATRILAVWKMLQQLPNLEVIVCLPFVSPIGLGFSFLRGMYIFGDNTASKDCALCFLDVPLPH